MRNSSIFSTFLICCIVLLSFTGCIDDLEATSSNIESAIQSESYDSIPIEYDNCIFYIENNMIYKKNSVETQLLFKNSGFNSDLCDFNIVEDKMYFFALENNGDFVLYRVSINGQNKELLLTKEQLTQNDEYYNGSIYYENKIYIQTSFSLYCYDISTCKAEMIENDVGIFQIVKDQLYYIDHAERTFTVYKLDLNTKEKKIVIGEGKIQEKSTVSNLYSNFIIIDDALICCKRNPDGLFFYMNNEEFLISNSEGVDEQYLLEYNGDLFFVQSQNGQNFIMKYDLSKKLLTTFALFDDHYSNLSVSGDYLYYKDAEKNLSKLMLS